GRNMRSTISMPGAAASRTRRSASAWWRTGRRSRVERPSANKSAGQGPGRFFNASEPRHQRRVDHVGHAARLVADRLDGEIHVLQRKAVGRDLLQREALGGDLLERQLAGLV